MCWCYNVEGIQFIPSSGDTNIGRHAHIVPSDRRDVLVLGNPSVETYPYSKKKQQQINRVEAPVYIVVLVTGYPRIHELVSQPS